MLSWVLWLIYSISVVSHCQPLLVHKRPVCLPFGLVFGYYSMTVPQSGPVMPVHDTWILRLALVHPAMLLLQLDTPTFEAMRCYCLGMR